MYFIDLFILFGMSQSARSVPQCNSWAHDRQDFDGQRPGDSGRQGRLQQVHAPGSGEPLRRSCIAIAGLLGCRRIQIRAGARMPRQVDYYFSFQSPWAYIGHKPFRDVAKTYRSQGQSQAGGAGRSVLGDRRPAADEAPSGAAALSDGRTAALARQARAEISSAAGELAVQCPARRWRGDRGGRGRLRSGSILRRAFPAVWEESSISPMPPRW